MVSMVRFGSNSGTRKSGFRVPDYITTLAVPPDEIIDTCGAGDTFTATTIACLHKGFDLQKTLNLACLIAGFKIGQRGYTNLGREFYQKQGQ